MVIPPKPVHFNRGHIIHQHKHNQERYYMFIIFIDSLIYNFYHCDAINYSKVQSDSHSSKHVVWTILFFFSSLFCCCLLSSHFIIPLRTIWVALAESVVLFSSASAHFRHFTYHQVMSRGNQLALPSRQKKQKTNKQFFLFFLYFLSIGGAQRQNNVVAKPFRLPSRSWHYM